MRYITVLYHGISLNQMNPQKTDGLITRECTGVGNL